MFLAHTETIWSLMNKNLLALSVAAAAMATSASAAVSSNIVGYVKLNLKKGFNLIANPLNNTSSATGNNVSVIFASVGDCSVLRWTGTGYSSTDFLAGVGIVGGTDFALTPGEAVFVDVPADVSLTTVGDALVGTQTKVINVGNNFVASKVPIAGTATELGLEPTDGTTVLTWSGTGYVAFDYLGGVGWPAGEPSFTVGQGFITQATTGFTWTKTFTVAP
jgi:opacity protein-like surface antigen